MTRPSGRGRWRLYRPPRLALRLAAASLLVAAAALSAVLFTAAQAVRRNAVASAFARLDGVAEAGLGNPPPDSSPAALADWAMRLAAFEEQASRIIPTRRERRVTLIAADGAAVPPRIRRLPPGRPSGERSPPPRPLFADRGRGQTVDCWDQNS